MVDARIAGSAGGGNMSCRIHNQHNITRNNGQRSSAEAREIFSSISCERSRYCLHGLPHSAANSTLASDNLFATMEACRNCHEDQMKNNCTYCHTSADTTTYTASPNPKRELIFSHKFHTEEQKVDCETCHKKLDDANALTGTLVPEMATCVTCHNDVKASNACEKCHTNFASLRPKDHNRSDFVHEHKQLARIDDAKCGTCHTQESCAECHDGGELMKVNVPGTDLVSPHSPRLMANDRGQGMGLTKVHDLNFRYTHGIEAKGKITECQTCHSDETFCTTCHIADGNGNQESFKPKSHSEAGFVILGVGSGGGQHAKLARRDIEMMFEHAIMLKERIRLVFNVTWMPTEFGERIRRLMTMDLWQPIMGTGIAIPAPVVICVILMPTHTRAV